jgi:hypothetical protein
MSRPSEELSRTELEDERRKRRLIKMVEDLASSPESSVPLASRDAAALQGIYNFWSNPRVKVEGILSGHVQNTVDRRDRGKVAPAIQDTAERKRVLSPERVKTFPARSVFGSTIGLVTDRGSKGHHL